jgi:hypothetical protein
VELRVVVTVNPLIKDILLLVALMVNATGVSIGVGGGVGVGVNPPSLDLEYEISDPITIGSRMIFFN